MQSDSADTRNQRLEQLEAEARHARETYHLYRAKSYGPRPTSAGRLRALERASSYADARLGRARRRIKELG